MSLAFFVPELARSIVRDGPIPEAGLVRPLAATALFVDISGFTRLVDVVTERFGDRGAERLQEMLNACFHPIVEAVDGAGGQVLAFPGDAALCLWPLAPSEADRLTATTLLAVRCALRLRDQLTRLRTLDGIPLQLRAMVTAGRAAAIMAGGVDGQWTLIVAGPAIRQLSSGAAGTGEVVISSEAAAVCRRFLHCGPHAAGWLVTGIVADAPRTPEPSVTAVMSGDSDLSVLVPASVRARLASGDERWLSEFRIVTVMFVVFTEAEAVEAPQVPVSTLQRIVRRFDGDLNQVVADDKGLTGVVVFGLFQKTHEDDARRAIATALALDDELRPQYRPRIGIATGRVFAGVRGGATRRELAVIGSTAILAARLAHAADRVLCDADTYAEGKAAFRFDAVGPLTLKGKGVVDAVWHPREPMLSDSDRARHTGGTSTARHHELTTIEGQLDALAERGHGGLIVITGEPGIGKSALVRAVRERARGLGLWWAPGDGDSIHASTPLHAWQSIITSLLQRHDPERLLDEPSLVARLTALLSETDRDWLPLLNPVLRTPIAENERTRHMTAESRARARRQMIGSLLWRVTSSQAVIIAVENTHWIDSTSWELLEDVVARLPRVLVLLTTRLTPESEARLASIRSDREIVELPLPPLTSDAITDIVARRVGADRLSTELALWIASRCEGNPLFGEELALMLLSRGAAAIKDGVFGLVPGTSRPNLAQLPSTVQSVLAARIDQLPAHEQLSIKIAAVLGRQFSLKALVAISPVEDSADTLATRIKTVVGAGLICWVNEAAQVLGFSHALVQEVAYGLLPFAQRRPLHRAAAEHIERSENTTDPAFAPILAHHWERAEVPARARDYLERASEHSLFNTSSNPEAEGFLTRLIALDQAQEIGSSESGSSAGAESRARWQRMLSQAISRQGRHAEAVMHVELGLSRLHGSIPQSVWRNGLEAACGIARRLVLPPRGPRSAHQRDAARLETIRLYDSLIQLHYIGESSTRGASTVLASTVALLRAVSLGEQTGLCAELSQSYSMMANLVAVCGRSRLALRYADLARQVAEEIGDRQALFRSLTIGQLPAFIFGRWSDAEARILEGIALGGSLRSVYEMLIAECTLGHIDLHRDRLDAAYSRFDDISRRARDASFPLPDLWAMAGRAEIELRRNRLREAVATAEGCLRLGTTQTSVDQNSRFQAYGVLASARARRGEIEEALAAVDPAMQAAAAGANLSFSSQAGFIGVTEALLAATGTRTGDAATWEPQLRRWLRRFRAAAFSRPILHPAYLYFRGVWHLQRGHRTLATHHFRKSIRTAERFVMPHDIRRASHALAQTVAPDRRPDAGPRA